MKRRYLRKWFEIILYIINIILIILAGLEIENLTLFILIKFSIIIMFTLNSLILIKYGRIIEYD